MRACHPAARTSQAALWLATFTAAACGGEDHGAPFREDLGFGPDTELVTNVHVHAPPELESIATGETGPDGQPLRASCASCHSIPGIAPVLEASAADVGPPHEGIVLAHGNNRCASCHDPEDRLSLRTADGRRVPITDAIELCIQCHGPQYRNFQNGAHGGMRGYWERRAGEHVRNHCIDCHDAHSPAYPTVQPMPAPRDRFRPAMRPEPPA